MMKATDPSWNWAVPVQPIGATHFRLLGFAARPKRLTSACAPAREVGRRSDWSRKQNERLWVHWTGRANPDGGVTLVSALAVTAAL